MKTRQPASELCDGGNRKGAIALITALLLTAILGMVACALDIGWIKLTRAQLQGVADASALAGGTELLPGLGRLATKTKEEVAEEATTWAVEFAENNRNGELDESFVDGDRDVKFGKATFEPFEREDGSEGCGCYLKIPAEDDPEYYNYVEVTTLRNQAGSNNGDRPLPLFFARIFGTNETTMIATATAAVLPANGFRVEPGSDSTANVMPFAFKVQYWERFLRAQDYYNQNPNVFDDPEALSQIPDPEYPGLDPPAPLFGAVNGDNQFVQIFFDDFTRTADEVVTPGADGHMEIDIFPRNLKFKYQDEIDTSPCSGNFGTLHFGDSNSTDEMRRRIREGLNADDLADFENNELVLSEEEPLDDEGDPGLSAGMKDALLDVVGECKAIILFTTAAGPGGNCVFELVDFLAASVVQVQLSGGSKRLLMQPCQLVDDNAIPDPDSEIGEDDTIFTPLILIR